MNKLIYMALIAMFLVGTANADIDRNQLEEQINGPKDHQLPESDYTRGSQESTPLIEKTDKSWSAKQGATSYRMLIQRIGNSIYNWNFMGPRGRQYIGTPMVYDPTIGEDGFIGVIENFPIYAEGNTTNPPDDYRISLIVSTDMGNEWSRDSVYAVSSSDINGNLYTKLLQYPSLGFTNTDGTRGPEDYDFLVTSMNVDPTTRNLIQMNALFGLGIPGSDRFISENNYDRVVNNASPDQQRYFRPQFVSSNANGAAGIHGISRLNPYEGAQYGYYGYIGFATSIGLDISVMPEELYYDKFYHGDNPSIGSSALTQPEIGTDPSGNVYVAALSNNVAQADEYDHFVPTVWKSTYGSNGPGEDFSEPNPMPSSIIVEWANSKFLADGVTQCDGFLELDRFVKQAFVVTGEDEYSFFTAVMPYKTSPTGTIEDASEVYVLENRYSGGAWSLHEVTQLNENAAFTNSQFPVYLRWEPLEREAKGIEVGEEPALLQFTSGRGFELEAAKTADGNNIVVKYLDFRGPEEVGIAGNASCTYNLADWKENIDNDSIPTEWKYFFVGQNEFGITDTLEQTQDYVRVNDIFVSYRSLGSDEWTERNVTNDYVNYQSTYMSRIVKDLNNITIALSTVDPYYMEGTIYDALPIQVGEIVSNEFNRGFSFGSYDATTETTENSGLAGIYEDAGWLGEVNNVKNDNEELSFSINKIAPNPTSNYFELLFETVNAGNAQIKMFDNLGNEVATLYDGVLPKGISGKSVFLSEYANLTSGNYFITMYMNGKSTTEILNVIK